MVTLRSLVDCATTLSLTYGITSPGPIPIPAEYKNTNPDPEVLFLLNFTTAQRTALLLSPSSLALLYTPANEHFGIVPVEAMACGIPVLACDSGGPTESIVDLSSNKQGTGWLKSPDATLWADALLEIVSLSQSEREAISNRAKARARSLFGMEAMAHGLDSALQEAVNMGKVDMFGTMGTLWLMLIGFLLAYLAGPFLIPVS